MPTTRRRGPQEEDLPLCPLSTAGSEPTPANSVATRLVRAGNAYERFLDKAHTKETD